MKFGRQFLLVAIIVGFSVPATAQSQSAEVHRGIDTLQLKTIFDEPWIAGNRPQPTAFHPTESALFFNWNDSSFAQNKQFRVDLNSRNVREISGNDSLIRRATISPDRRQMVYREGDDLMISGINGRNKRVLASLIDYRGNPVWSASNNKIAVVSDGNIWSVDVNSGQTRKVTNFDSGSKEISIRSWAAGDSLVVYSTLDRSEQRTVYFPTYVGHFVESGASQRGVAEISLHAINAYTRQSKTLVGGKLSMRGVTVSPSGRYIVTDIGDEFLENREIGTYDAHNSYSYNQLHSESTEGWIHSSWNNVRFAPDQDVLMFTSETDGWNHIYTVNANGSNFRQITNGDWQVDWNQWLDQNRIAFASTQVDPGERHVYIHDLRRNQTTQITQEPGFRNNFVLSHDSKHLAYQFTYFNQPDDIVAINLDRPRGEIRLTNSVLDRFTALQLSMPEYIRFTGRDGTTELSMELIKPYDFDPNQQYPVVVFMHGAGSLQNVYKGWSANYWREYLFHHYLAQRGYVVIEVDFRHSLGYGRKFREDVTNWMGKYELEDVIDGIDLVAEDGYIDVNRVGVYGGSYGGFMSLYALSVAPDRFHVGAALRAVTNWENYYWANPWYTGPRLGHPERDSLNYERSSPLSFADSLSRPALILHGLIDDNVGFQDAMQYVDRLIKSGNEEFDLMVFPSERHSFTQSEMWYDQYRRIFNYFERYLK